MPKPNIDRQSQRAARQVVQTQRRNQIQYGNQLQQEYAGQLAHVNNVPDTNDTLLLLLLLLQELHKKKTSSAPSPNIKTEPTKPSRRNKRSQVSADTSLQDMAGLSDFDKQLISIDKKTLSKRDEVSKQTRGCPFNTSGDPNLVGGESVLAYTCPDGYTETKEKLQDETTNKLPSSIAYRERLRDEINRDPNDFVKAETDKEYKELQQAIVDFSLSGGTILPETRELILQLDEPLSENQTADIKKSQRNAQRALDEVTPIHERASGAYNNASQRLANAKHSAKDKCHYDVACDQTVEAEGFLQDGKIARTEADSKLKQMDRFLMQPIRNDINELVGERRNKINEIKESLHTAEPTPEKPSVPETNGPEQTSKPQEPESGIFLPGQPEEKTQEQTEESISGTLSRGLASVMDMMMLQSSSEAQSAQIHSQSEASTTPGSAQ